MDSLPAEPARVHNRRVTPEDFAPCYALLAETFAPDELESAAVMQADLAAPADDRQPVQYLMLARSLTDSSPPDGGGPLEGGPVISLIAGCYLALPEDEFPHRGIGFIEYLATRQEYQRQGHASALLQLLESELQNIAAGRGARLSLVMGEIEPEMVDFKARRGYRQPCGSHYCQPPICFDAVTGEARFPPLPKLLMVKTWDSAVPTALLLSAVRTVFAKRYLPRRGAPQARGKASEYIRRTIYEPFARSLTTRGDDVRMAVIGS
jgi:ribosomal protein S18 acetylase RimI-like enzyme